MVAIVPIELPCEMEAFGLILRKDRLLSPAASKVLKAVKATAASMYGVTFKPDEQRPTRKY
jgi:hypothetical protein